MEISLGVDSTRTALWCSSERRTESDDKRRVEFVIIWSRLFVFYFSFYSAGIKMCWTSPGLNSITWPGLFTSKTVRKLRKFISDHKDFIIHLLSFLIFHPHFVICIFPSAFCIPANFFWVKGVRVPGFLKTTRTYPKFSEDFRRYPKMSKDVPNNSEFLMKMIQCSTFKSSIIP